MISSFLLTTASHTKSYAECRSGSVADLQEKIFDIWLNLVYYNILRLPKNTVWRLFSSNEIMKSDPPNLKANGSCNFSIIKSWIKRKSINGSQIYCSGSGFITLNGLKEITVVVNLRLCDYAEGYRQMG
jgi:hypothetical protein